MDVGVVIGRFQVPDLTDGHLFLIQRAQQGHRRVLVLIGSPQEYGTLKNPLDYPTRERMIRARFPDVVVQALPDMPGNNKHWSKSIDATIKTVYPQATDVTLYAGRDSFRPHYAGAWPVIEADSGISYVSGTEARKNVGKVVLDSADFRRGVIYATQNPARVEQTLTPVEPTPIPANAYGRAETTWSQPERCAYCKCKIESGYHEEGCPVRKRGGDK